MRGVLTLTRTKTPDPDDLLALRCQAGHEDAFDGIVLRYHPRLYRFAYRMLCDPAEADDAVQETMVRAFKAIRAYRPCGYFSSWIYRIALNECRRRGRYRHQDVSLEAIEHLESGSDPERDVIRSSRNERVRTAMTTLPDSYREALSLFYFEELGVHEIARVVGATPGAVKVRLHRARAKLAKQLEGVV